MLRLWRSWRCVGKMLYMMFYVDSELNQKMEVKILEPLMLVEMVVKLALVVDYRCSRRRATSWRSWFCRTWTASS